MFDISKNPPSISVEKCPSKIKKKTPCMLFLKVENKKKVYQTKSLKMC